MRRAWTGRAMFWLLFFAATNTVGVWPLAQAQLAPNRDGAAASLALDRAKQAASAGDPVAAEAGFRQAVELDPQNVESNYRLGSLLIQRNAIDEGVGYLQRSVELGGNNLSLRMSVGNIFEQIRLVDQALVHYRFVADKSPNSPEGIEAEKRLNLVLAKDYASKGDLDTSLQILSALAQEHPDDTRVLQHLGFAYFIARRYEPAVAIYQEVIEREPNSDTAYLNLANVYEQMGDYSHAIESLEAVAKLVPEGPKHEEAMVRGGILRAFQFSRDGKFELASEELDGVLTRVPDHPIANGLAGDVLRQLGRLSDAQAAWERALRITPKNLDVRLKLANLFLDQNNFVDAVWELDRIIREGPNSSQAFQANTLVQRISQTFGNQMAEIRSIGVSKNKFKNRLLLNPGDVEAHFNMGIIYRQQGLIDQARNAFESVRLLDPSIARTYANLAQIYFQQNQFEAAADAMAIYISLETNVQDVEGVAISYANILGNHLYNQNQLRPAYDQFQRILETAPNDAAAHFYSGVILARLGQLEESTKELEIVAELAPDHLGARQQLAALYDQLGREQQALTEYKRIALSTQDANLRLASEKRAAQIQRSINGLTTSVGYTMSYDPNSNYSESNPQEEHSGSLSVNLTYRYKYNDKTRLGLSVSPSYTTYHRGGYDYLNELYNPFISYGTPEDLYTLRYSFNQLSGLLNEQEVNETTTLSLDRNWDYSLNEKVTLTGSIRDYQAATTDRFDLTTYTFSGNYSRNLGRGLSDGFTASLAINNNKSDLNPDAAYDSLSFGYQTSKWMSSNLFVGLTGNVSFTRYRNPDTYATFSNLDSKIRQVFFYSLAGSLNYRLNDDIRVFSSVTYQQNDSNIPLLQCRNVTDEDGNSSVECIPLTSQEFIGVSVSSASQGDYAKMLVSFGITVNF